MKGAFDEEIEGLKNALADGRIIVNIDICVNRGNVKHLPAMLEKFTAMGVREYDLLHVIPFGAAWREGKEVLFYDLEKMRPYLVEAFAWAKKPDMHIWLNRFPVKHCEGFHELIQDPYKLNDEIRGRKEEFQQWIDVGEPLDCREPRRCGYCYLKHVCDAFETTQREVFLEASFDVVRVDLGWEAQQAPVFGGDPASAKRKRRLPMAQLTYRKPEELAAEAGARTLHIVAPTLRAATKIAERFDLPELELRLKDWGGIESSELPLRRLFVSSREEVERLAPLADEGDIEIVLDLTTDVARWLLTLDAPPTKRFALRPADLGTAHRVRCEGRRFAFLLRGAEVGGARRGRAPLRARPGSSTRAPHLRHRHGHAGREARGLSLRSAPHSRRLLHQIAPLPHLCARSRLPRRAREPRARPRLRPDAAHRVTGSGRVAQAASE